MNISSTCCKIFTFSLVISPKILIARPGPGKGCLPSNCESIPNALPILLTSSLNNRFNGSTIFNFIKSGSPPTL